MKLFFLIHCFVVKVPYYISAQIVGSVLATYVGRSIYGIQPEIITTRPLQGCSSAFWIELIATFIIMFLAVSLTNQAQSVRKEKKRKERNIGIAIVG